MGLISKNKIIIAIILPIVILVLIKSFGGDNFKSDLKRWADPSVSMSNIIPFKLIETIQGQKLIINLDEETGENFGLENELININADSILVKNTLKKIRKHDGPVLLVSNDVAISARIWMILSQMGSNNIFIITSDTVNEDLKYKFRPDTTLRPEL